MSRSLRHRSSALPLVRRPVLLLLVALAAACARRPAVPDDAPPRLADTGLYADFARRQVATDVMPFTPQYPLWTDGAAKQRWIALPPGESIDASRVDHWQFPIGTRLWKQFAFERCVETRFLWRRADGSWGYATYRWSEDGRDATLAPAGGVRGACATRDGAMHDLPSVADCRLCHEGTATPVLGFSALQLSSDRDPLAPGAAAPAAGDVDLPALVARGLVRGLPARFVAEPPRIAARTPDERAALGYLFGNCSSCHNADGPLARLGLRFDYPLGAPGPAPAIASTVGVPSQFRAAQASERVAPGAPDRSVLVRRLAATDAVTQMPPFGRHLVDRDALTLVGRWIQRDLAATAGTPSSHTPIESLNPTRRP